MDTEITRYTIAMKSGHAFEIDTDDLTDLNTKLTECMETNTHFIWDDYRINPSDISAIFPSDTYVQTEG